MIGHCIAIAVTSYGCFSVYKFCQFYYPLYFLWFDSHALLRLLRLALSAFSMASLLPIPCSLFSAYNFYTCALACLCLLSLLCLCVSCSEWPHLSMTKNWQIWDYRTPYHHCQLQLFQSPQNLTVLVTALSSVACSSCSSTSFITCSVSFFCDLFALFTLSALLCSHFLCLCPCVLSSIASAVPACKLLRTT